MLSLFRYLNVTSVTTFGNWDSSSARFARRRTLGKNMEICTKFPTTRKNIHILAYFAHQVTLLQVFYILLEDTKNRVGIDRTSAAYTL